MPGGAAPGEALPLAAVSAHNLRLLLVTRPQLQGLAHVEALLNGEGAGTSCLTGCFVRVRSSGVYRLCRIMAARWGTRPLQQAVAGAAAQPELLLTLEGVERSVSVAEVSGANPLEQQQPQAQQLAAAELGRLRDELASLHAALAQAPAAGAEPRAAPFSVQSAAEACWRRRVSLKWAERLQACLAKHGLPRLVQDLQRQDKIAETAAAVQASGQLLLLAAVPSTQPAPAESAGTVSVSAPSPVQQLVDTAATASQGKPEAPQAAGAASGPAPAAAMPSVQHPAPASNSASLQAASWPAWQGNPASPCAMPFPGLAPAFLQPPAWWLQQQQQQPQQQQALQHQAVPQQAWPAWPAQPTMQRHALQPLQPCWQVQYAAGCQQPSPLPPGPQLSGAGAQTPPAGNASSEPQPCGAGGSATGLALSDYTPEASQQLVEESQQQQQQRRQQQWRQKQQCAAPQHEPAQVAGVAPAAAAGAHPATPAFVRRDPRLPGAPVLAAPSPARSPLAIQSAAPAAAPAKLSFELPAGERRTLPRGAPSSSASESRGRARSRSRQSSSGRSGSSSSSSRSRSRSRRRSQRSRRDRRRRSRKHKHGRRGRGRRRRSRKHRSRSRHSRPRSRSHSRGRSGSSSRSRSESPGPALVEVTMKKPGIKEFQVETGAVGATLRAWRLYRLVESDLVQVFMHCRGFLRVRMLAARPVAFVDFDTATHAAIALELMQTTKVNRTTIYLEGDQDEVQRLLGAGHRPQRLRSAWDWQGTGAASGAVVAACRSPSYSRWSP